VESGDQGECAFLFQVLLKPMVTHTRGRTWWFSSNDQCVGRGMNVPRPGEGSLWVRAWSIWNIMLSFYEHRTFSNFSLLHNHYGNQYGGSSKNLK
jgi:hypothetical protein